MAQETDTDQIQIQPVSRLSFDMSYQYNDSFNS